VALVWPWCGLGVALVWPWCSLGVALVWLCTPESMPSICLVYGLGVALDGFARPLAEATKREGWLGHCVFSQTPGSGLEHGAVETARGTGRRGFHEAEGAIRRVIGADGGPGREV
jgi:hypothetical protein